MNCTIGKGLPVRAVTEAALSNAKVLCLQIGLYRPNHGRLIAFQAVPSKLKSIKKNVETVLANTDKFFKLDPNGYAVPVDTDPTPELTQARADAEKLAASTGSLYERLMAQANGSTSSSVGSSAAAGARAAPAAPLNGTSVQAERAASGSGGTAQSAAPLAAPAVASGSNGAAAPAAAVQPVLSAEDAKAQFLQQWGHQYGYQGAIDALYAREIGMRLPPGQHYLDYTGSSLYCRTPLQAAFEDLQARLQPAPRLFRSRAFVVYRQPAHVCGSAAWLALMLFISGRHGVRVFGLVQLHASAIDSACAGVDARFWQPALSEPLQQSDRRSGGRRARQDT